VNFLANVNGSPSVNFGPGNPNVALTTTGDTASHGFYANLGTTTSQDFGLISQGRGFFGTVGNLPTIIYNLPLMFSTGGNGTNGDIGFWHGTTPQTLYVGTATNSVTGTVSISNLNTIISTSTNGYVLPGTNFFTSGISGPPNSNTLPQMGGQIVSDGTNLLVVLMDAAQNKTTNKVQLSSWPTLSYTNVTVSGAKTNDTRDRTFRYEVQLNMDNLGSPASIFVCITNGATKWTNRHGLSTGASVSVNSTNAYECVLPGNCTWGAITNTAGTSTAVMANTTLGL
jgi:hypothetical protein